MTASNRPLRNQPLVADLPEHATFKLIGAGGVGGIVTRYGVLYTVYLADLLGKNARWIVIDGDTFEPKNRARMLFGSYGNKAAVLCEELSDVVIESRVMLAPVEEFISEENVDRLLHNGDIILLTVDNHATRKLVNDYCADQLDDFCLISGGNDGVGEDDSGRFLRGTYGSCQVFLKGCYQSPSLSQYHPEIAQPTDRLPTAEDLDCTEILTTQPQNLFANLATASAILNTFWLYLCDQLHYSELAFDIADGLMRPVPLPEPRPT